MKKISKKQAIFLSLLFVFGLGLAGCAKVQPAATNTAATGATSTEEIDTSNWKTYRNEEYGFEFRYPEDWYYDICASNYENHIAVFSDKTVDCINDIFNVVISLEKTDKFDFNDKVRRLNLINATTTEVFGKNNWQVIIGDIQNEDAEGNHLDGSFSRAILSAVEKNNNIFVISLFSGFSEGLTDKRDKEIMIYDAIINSVLFN